MSNPDDRAALERELAECRARRGAAEDAAQQLRMFLDSVQDYAFISLDLDGKVVGWSGGAERILDYTEEQALGLHTSVFFTPEDVASGQDLKEMLLARTEGRAEDERWHLRRDGVRFWGSGVMTPLYAEDGRHRGYSKVMRDHTARRLAEARIRDSEERLRLFCENVHDYALVPVDLEGRVVGWNIGAGRIFGYSADEILGQNSNCFFTPEDRERGVPEADLGRSITDGRVEDERWMVRRDGTRFWSYWITTPILDETGQLRGFAKVLQDVTERRAAQELREQLQEQERLLLALQVRSAGEALDRTKEELRALAGSLLRAQEDERRRIARELHDDLSQRLALLANNLAALHAALPEAPAALRSEAHRLELDVGALSGEVRRLSHQLHPSILDDLGLAPALRQLVRDFQTRRAAPATFTSQSLPDSVPPAAAAALYRITQEALRNIHKHSVAGPVQVRLEGTPGELRLQVEDAGPGFDPAEVRGRGGLGIISMQERARLVGGTLRVASRPGTGTLIDVVVPLPADDHDVE